MSSAKVKIACVVDGSRLALSTILLYTSARHMIPDAEFYFGVPEDADPELSTKLVNKLPNTQIVILPTPPSFQGRQYRIINKIALLSRLGDTKVILCDSDLLFVRPFPVKYLAHLQYGAKVADACSWNGDWDYVYKKFNLPTPIRRVITTQTKEISFPYYNSGFFIAESPRRFGETWLHVTRDILSDTKIEGRFPYADQISLPITAKMLGIHIEELDIAFNNSIHDLRKDIFVLHHHDYYQKLEGSIPGFLTHWKRTSPDFNNAFHRAAARFDRGNQTKETRNNE